MQRLLVVLFSIFLFACSSTSNEEKQLELLAANRASLIQSELPYEVGPLHIMRASASKSMIEIMMIYNSDESGAKPIKQVLNQSIKFYCNDKTTLANLDIGIAYRIKMRNPRGQLMVDQIITKKTCEPVKNPS
ncbi:GspS/AspS pilotin family protein [Vibrio sp.]|nr:GspS/AspS pilotin family protein [Vibrio viridaestus]MDC0609666.1 GspS/AspS pilotin family protein [Vibrio sp.]